MTPEQIVGLMLCAGAETQDGGKHWEFDDFSPEKFAKLIEAATREECARVCRDMQNGFASDQHIECAEAIEGMK